MSGSECAVMNDTKGYTLIELLVVIAIMAVLVMLAYPSFLGWLQGMEAKRVQKTLEQVLLQTRMRSASTRQTLTVCLADAQDVCQRAGSVSVLVFKDDNNNGRMEVAELIDKQALNIRHGVIVSRWSLHRNHVKFFGDTGMPRGHFGHISYCSSSNHQAHSYRVIMTQHGFVRVGVGC